MTIVRALARRLPRFRWRRLRHQPGRTLRQGARSSLPADHASHPDYKIEWWYYTGNLDATDRRRFGYQLTFFRIGVDPAPGESISLGGS